MLKSFAVAGALLCFAAVGPAAYAQDHPNDTKVVIKDDTTPKVKQGAKAVTDASITTAVKTRLMKDKVARGTSIDVDTKDHVVTLAGNVPTAADKVRIGRIAKNTSGVKSVENHLTVSGGVAATTGKSDKNDHDLHIVVKDDTTPMVKKGAHETANAAKTVGGKVADVSKDVAGTVSDGSITTAVKTRLMGDDVARGTHIDVDTHDGIVTIGGTVPTTADRARIGELVAHTTGVKRVVNDLKVGS